MEVAYYVVFHQQMKMYFLLNCLVVVEVEAALMIVTMAVFFVLFFFCLFVCFVLFCFFAFYSTATTERKGFNGGGKICAGSSYRRVCMCASE